MISVLRKRKDPRREQIEAVSEELRHISEELEASDARFNEVSDSDLVEAMIFERSALNARYSYLLKELKRLERTEDRGQKSEVR